MTKYARIKEDSYIDVWRIPQDFPDIETLNRCLPGGGFIVVDEDLLPGAKDTGNGTFINPTTASPVNIYSIARDVGRATRIGNIRARAVDLRKRGKHLEALSLLSTIGE